VVSADQRDWADQIPLVEFALNSSTNASTGFCTFELTYGYVPTMLQSAPATEFKGVRDFVELVVQNIVIAHDAIIEAHVVSESFSNRRRRPDSCCLITGNLAYLSIQDLNMPKAQASKLLPKFIGPYKIIDSDPIKSNYTLELPAELRARWIHPKFHADCLRAHIPNDDAQFPNCEALFFYDFCDDPAHEWAVAEIVGHDWRSGKLWFSVLWDVGDTTMEPFENCKDLAALDRYLKLHGVDSYTKLSKPCARI
jgi:hypothetical protein